MKRLIPYITLLLALLLAGCDDMKDIPLPIDLPTTANETGKFYVLSEGLFNMNNSKLCLLNFDNHSLNTDYFLYVNNRSLGDTGNDMKVYGSKLWIVMNVSSQLEVVDLKSGISIKRIAFFNENNVPRQPRYITFSANKAYICSFDGTVARIDTSSLTIEAITRVGRNPDGITTANGKLYVANSGGLDASSGGVYDNTVSVIDINTFAETKKITVGINPFKPTADSQGDVYTVVRGDNSTVKASFCRISSQSDEVIQTFVNLPALNFTIKNDTAYLYSFNYSNNSYWVKTFDCKTEQIISENFITDGTTLVRPFGIYIHPNNGHVYLTDALNYTIKGDLYCFNRNGKLQYKVESVGLNPSTMLALP